MSMRSSTWWSRLMARGACRAAARNDSTSTSTELTQTVSSSLHEPVPEAAGLSFGVHELHHCRGIQVDHRALGVTSGGELVRYVDLRAGSPSGIRSTARRISAARSRRSAASSTACRMSGRTGWHHPASARRGRARCLGQCARLQLSPPSGQHKTSCLTSARPDRFQDGGLTARSAWRARPQARRTRHPGRRG